MVDLDDLMDLAERDPEGQRLELAIERLNTADLRELARDAVRFGAQTREYRDAWEDGY